MISPGKNFDRNEKKKKKKKEKKIRSILHNAVKTTYFLSEQRSWHPFWIFAQLPKA